MNWIEKMIAEQCPNGVKKVKLGNVAMINRGKRVVRKELSKNGRIPVFQNSLRPLGFHSESNYPAYTPFVISAGAAGEVGFSDIPFWAADDCLVLAYKKDANGKYFYHYLKTKEQFLKNQIRGGAIKRLSRDVVENLEIPLPPLSIQEEIVSVLDKFSELIEKTDAEIALRQKQYEYYREKLLTFEKGEDCKEMSLGEIGKMKRGNGLQKSDFRANGFPCIHYGQIHTSYGLEAKETISFCENSLAKKLKKAKYGDLLIATTSEDVEACCKAVVWLGNEEVAFSGDSFCFSHNQNPKYISYLFCTEQFAKQKRKVATGAKVVRVSGDAMEKFTFLFPSLSRQQEIVETLDKFETLISKLKEERELRQKQYEYYREKLLTF